MKNKLVPYGFLITAFAACGDGINDGQYQGEPLTQLKGQIQSIASRSGEHDVYVGIGWDNWTTNAGISGTQVLPITQSNFPSEFELTLFDAPSDQLLNDFYRVPVGELRYIQCTTLMRPDLLRSVSCTRSNDTTYACEFSAAIAGTAGTPETANETDCSFTIDSSNRTVQGDCVNPPTMPWGAYESPAQWKDNLNWSSDVECEEAYGIRGCSGTINNMYCSYEESLRASNGKLGTGYIAVFEDINNNHQLDLQLSDEEPMVDRWLGAAPKHMLLYAKNVDEGLRQSLRERLIVNPELLQEGYNLARFVCAKDTGTTFDQLSIVPFEDIEIRDLSTTTDLCTNIH